MHFRVLYTHALAVSCPRSAGLASGGISSWHDKPPAREPPPAGSAAAAGQRSRMCRSETGACSHVRFGVYTVARVFQLQIAVGK